MNPPDYFERVRQNAARRWEQLEADPELAGPWHQLFKQVQSPPHVLSELLQNADDVGATKASATIKDGEFIFEHNGSDFTGDQFGSLCRFAFSNKRTLHTIGFRGVGFKSTFSLGDNVEVHTPTLGVSFNAARFTLPVWLESSRPTTGPTIVRVRVADEHRLNELEQSLRSWESSPASLLFFRNLKELDINGRVVKKTVAGNGPVDKSQVVALTHVGALRREKTESILIVQSAAEAFPEEAVREIRKERNIKDEELPPCSVDLVFGISGQQRLFVILPTGASVELPFSVNAPFIQDPARYGIKEPSTSPTNRWLLARAGELAATALVEWLGNTKFSGEDRAKAYGLLPAAKDPSDDSNGRITQCLREAMFAGLESEPILLQSDGEVSQARECVSLPPELHDIWSEEQLVHLFAKDKKGLLNTAVATPHRTILHGHGWISQVSPDSVLEALQADDASPPQPATWPQLRALWSFVSDNTNRYWDNRPKKLKIVPVAGEAGMFAASEVVRLPGRSQLSADDWKFVTDNAHAINGSWLEWLAQQKPKKKDAGEKVEDAANILLHELGLSEATSIDKIVAAASRKVFREKSVDLADCVHFAHILAALGATAPDDFQFVTRDLMRRIASHQIVFDPAGAVEDLTPANWGEEHILHDDYTGEFKSCTAQAWDNWIASGKSRLLVSLPITRREQNFWSTYSFEQHLKAHGLERPYGYPYSSGSIDVEDWSFDRDIRGHWEKVLEAKPGLHAAVLANILKGPASNWQNKLSATPHQNGRKYRQRVNCSDIPADWILTFRSLPCLKDTHGTARVPAEILLRTPDTEALRDIEPFVAAEFDVPDNRPLLELLGVRSTPTGSKKIIDRLETLSRIPNASQLLLEVGKLYEALDRIVARCSPDELQTTGEAFETKAIILGESLEWKTSDEISIYPDDDNQADAIHNLYRNLAMWPKLNVPEKPAFERALEWLRNLLSGQRVEAAAVTRVRSILRREPHLVWDGCQHWLSLDQTWEPANNLTYRQTMQNLSKWDGLAPAVKQATADLRMLPEMIWQQAPFAGLRNLADVVDFEVTEVRESGERTAKPWLTALGNCLARVKLGDEQHTLDVRAVAKRLQQTRWQPFSRLEVTPYVDGTPAGVAITPRVLWQDTSIYVPADTSMARLHKELVDELARPFGDRSIAEAISACVERDGSYVEEYLTDQFDLEEQLEPTNDPKENMEEEAEDTGSGDSEGKKPSPAKDDGAGEKQDDVGERDENLDAEDDLDDDTEDDDGEDSEKPRRKSSPAKPDLMDRYAAKRGFKWHAGEKCYTHQDGRWIERAEAPFHWVEKSTDGVETLRLWVQEQTLAHGIELPAEIWSLLRTAPKAAAILIKDGIESPADYSGEDLFGMQASNRIKLYPARYRIVEVGQ